MDDCRFDNWTRMLGKFQDRRAALRDLAGAGVALVALARADLGLAQKDDVLIEGCRLSGEGCSRNTQCCSDICKGRGRKRRDRNERDGDGRRRRRRTATREPASAAARGRVVARTPRVARDVAIRATVPAAALARTARAMLITTAVATGSAAVTTGVTNSARNGNRLAELTEGDEPRGSSPSLCRPRDAPNRPLAVQSLAHRAGGVATVTRGDR